MSHSVEYYLSKGCNQEIAEYFAGGREVITTVRANEDYSLLLGFDNGEHRVYDMKPLLKKGVFELLADFNNFKRVYLDNSNCVSWDIDPNIDSGVVWNNKVDLCPDSCYIDSIPVARE